jgi:hypothetical protein
MSSLIHAAENDSLHILPLSIIPLQVKALQDTRLIKNTRLEGVVEIFREDATGSGQVTPDALQQVFDFSNDRVRDLRIVKRLAALQSYDVYSLRVSLRQLNIPVDNVESLRLSAEMAARLSEHMSAFTRPLVLRVYGDANVGANSFRDVLMLFADPNAAAARENLRELAKLLEIKMFQIPQFLEHYADVFLSLSFYQKCHDDTEADLGNFLDDLRELAHDPRLNGNITAARDIERAANRIHELHQDVANILDLFRVRTEDMWQNLSSERYRRMSQLVVDHHEKIGAILCATSVKLNAWKQHSFSSSFGGVSDKVNFVTREIGYGLDNLSSLEFEDM